MREIISKSYIYEKINTGDEDAPIPRICVKEKTSYDTEAVEVDILSTHRPERYGQELEAMALYDEQQAALKRAHKTNIDALLASQDSRMEVPA